MIFPVKEVKAYDVMLDSPNELMSYFRIKDSRYGLRSSSDFPSFFVPKTKGSCLFVLFVAL